MEAWELGWIEVIDADPVTVGDDEFPVFFSATDAVAGVGRVDLLLDNQTAALDSQSQGCPGGGCPFEGSLALDTASIPEGTHTIRVRVWDGFGNWRDSASQAIIVDKTPPALSLSGALAAADGTTVTAPAYGLTASATDPASGGVAAGVTQTTFNVAAASDGASQECPAGGCSQTSQFTYETGHYSTGTHEIEVSAQDAAGNTTDRTITVTDQGAQTTCAPSGVDGFGNPCDPPPAWCTAQSEPAAPAGPAGLRLTGVQARDAIEAARPGVLAASTTTEASGEQIRPTVAPETGGFEGQWMASDADLPAAPAGGRIVGPPGQESCIVPVGVAADATAGVKSGDAVVYANVKPGVDLAARATPEGLDQVLQIRDSGSPRTFAWRVPLQAGERLEQLSDQSVAIVSDSPANEGTTSQPPEAALEGSAVTPSTVADSALQLQTSRTQAQAAADKVEGDVQAVISAPSGIDAAQNPVATTLTASGDTVTLQASQPAAYPATVRAGAASTVAVKVMTYNIRGHLRPKPDVRYQLPAWSSTVARRFANTIGSEAPDILVLQEACRGHVDQIMSALRQPVAPRKPLNLVLMHRGVARVGLNAARCPGAGYGNWILARSGAVPTEKDKFCSPVVCTVPLRPGRERRNMVAATISLKGVSLRVFNLHLEAGEEPTAPADAARWVGQWERTYQAFAQRVAASPAENKIAAGDFNARSEPTAANQRRLMAPFFAPPNQPPLLSVLRYKDADAEARYTVLARQLFKKVDYVFVPPSWTGTTARTPVAFDSDHVPIGVTVRVPR